jgi:hypothetical protein
LNSVRFQPDCTSSRWLIEATIQRPGWTIYSRYPIYQKNGLIRRVLSFGEVLILYLPWTLQPWHFSEHRCSGNICRKDSVRYSFVSSAESTNPDSTKLPTPMPSYPLAIGSAVHRPEYWTVFGDVV